MNNRMNRRQFVKHTGAAATTAAVSAAVPMLSPGAMPEPDPLIEAGMVGWKTFYEAKILSPDFVVALAEVDRIRFIGSKEFFRSPE